MLYKGFVGLEDDARGFPPTETLVFENEEQWNDFANNYFDMLPSRLGRYNKYVDFSHKKIVCKIIMPTNAISNVSANLDKITLNDDILNIEWSQGNDRIYIISPNDEIIYPFVFLVTVENNENLSNLKNIYEKK